MLLLLLLLTLLLLPLLPPPSEHAEGGRHAAGSNSKFLAPRWRIVACLNPRATLRWRRLCGSP
jgi:hypothetical protein